MAGRAEILKAADKLVAAQERNVKTGGLQDQTITDRESPGEETAEDALALEDQPSLLSIRDSDAL